MQKMKIWVDEKGTRHISLDGMEIGNILRNLTLDIHPGMPSQVELNIYPPCIEVEIDAKVDIIMDGNKYHLVSIRKE